MNYIVSLSTVGLAMKSIPVVLMLNACSSTGQQAEKIPPPNIVVILVDDAGYTDFGFMGCRDLKTPNIDKLANNGVVFSDAHVSATVSGPSRAGLMTGRYQQRFGFECNPSHNNFTGLDLNEETLAEALKNAGYNTAAFGKWHLGDAPEYRPNARGFDYFWGFLAGGRSYFSNHKNDVEGDIHSILENDQFQTFEGYLTDRLGDQAVDYIEANKEKPFFIYWAPNAVHTPMEATQEDMEIFEGHPRQKLAAMTWALDRAVGNIISKLETEKLLENTLIFFLSDNGGAYNNLSSNLPLKGYKGNKFEGGHRVAFFMHWPRELKEPKTFDGLTSSLDIFATSIAVSGGKRSLEIPMDGVNLLPFLNGCNEEEPHENLYWRKDKMAAHRNGDFKIIKVENLGYRMYNLKENLQETKDLSSSELEVFEKLSKELEHWETGLMEPLWTEGHIWDTITWMIHQDYFLNREVRVENPQKLKKWSANANNER